MINPCRHCGNEPQENVAISRHTIICVPCWNEATGTHYDAAVRNWNSENPPPKPKAETIKQSVVYTTAIGDANPCNCSYPSRVIMSYSLDDIGTHKLTCSRCGYSVQDSFYDQMIAKWNSINIDAPVDDAAYIQAYAQSGNAEQTAADYEATNQERFWRPLVKRTPELPDYRKWVLFWHCNSWVMAQYATYASGQAVWWIDDVSYDLHDGQYWLPLPTFNPESEG